MALDAGVYGIHESIVDVSSFYLVIDSFSLVADLLVAICWHGFDSLLPFSVSSFSPSPSRLHRLLLVGACAVAEANAGFAWVQPNQRLLNLQKPVLDLY